MNNKLLDELKQMYLEDLNKLKATNPPIDPKDFTKEQENLVMSLYFLHCGIQVLMDKG